jgi:hypothetical protein
LHLRSFRTLLLFTCLLCPVILSRVRAVRATISSTHQGRSFQPTGRGIVIPKVGDTASMPQVHGAEPASLSIPPAAPSGQTRVLASHHLLAPQNVVSVPAPARTDPSAKKGLYNQWCKPDANGAGGLDNYFETVKGKGVAIYSRSGKQQYTSTFQAWLGINSTFFDSVTMCWTSAPVFAYQDMIDWSESPTCFYGCGKEPMALYYLAG